MHYDIKTAIRVRSQNFQLQYLKQFTIRNKRYNVLIKRK
jgi:hypothetical protein